MNRRPGPDTPLSVLQIVGGGGVGGVERISVVLAEELVRQGHRVTHLVLGEPGPTSDLARAAGLDVRVLGLPIGLPRAVGGVAGVPRGLIATAGSLRPRRYDVIQAHLYRSTQLGRVLGRILGVPVVGAVHGIDPDERKRRQMRGLVSRVDATVCVSNGLRRRLVDVDGFATDRLVVVPNGLADADFEAPSAAMRPAVRVTSEADAVVIGCVGRLYARKGQSRLFAAFVSLAAANPHAHLALVGDGPDRAELESASRVSPFADRIHVVGEQAQPGPWLRGFDVLAMPSDFEGFGLVVLEAQRAGVPVVSCAAGGPADLIEDSVSGRQVGPDRLAYALTEAVRHPDRRAQWAEAARRSSQAYTASRMSRGYLGVYHEMFARRRS